MKYLCDDGNCEIEIDEDSAEEAAQEYVDGGDWGESNKTCWIDVHVQPADSDDDWDRECISIAIEPDEPECSAAEHDWQDDGCYGHGGGVIRHEVCAICGLTRIFDGWAQNPATGEQGLESVEYREAGEQR